MLGIVTGSKSLVPSHKPKAVPLEKKKNRKEVISDKGAASAQVWVGSGTCYRQFYALVQWLHILKRSRVKNSHE